MRVSWNNTLQRQLGSQLHAIICDFFSPTLDSTTHYRHVTMCTSRVTPGRNHLARAFPYTPFSWITINDSVRVMKANLKTYSQDSKIPMCLFGSIGFKRDI